MSKFDLYELRSELDRWRDLGRRATFWWRDDDATEPSAELDALLRVSSGRPLALATVPYFATSALAERLREEPHVTIFQHGWKHENHASDGPQSEYPGTRAPNMVAREFAEGSAKLDHIFGKQFAWVFAPPWHGLDPAFTELLAPAGIRGLSRKGRRSAASAAGLSQNNVHCVPIQWSTPPGFGDPRPYIEQLTNHLRSRRIGDDQDEPTGILTHHLVQTTESLHFVGAVLDVISDHSAARFVDAREIFGTCARSAAEEPATREGAAQPTYVDAHV